ncbi:MAG: DUF5320 domain-containing protein [Candidatus Eisenbacteria sp.]|nr:DUF5320 domain-containing protein [Candidatus Eisenbacteria bacterium]
MPRGNGTGPMGMGPMTGRAAGYCAGFGVPGYMNWGGGGSARGLGWPAVPAVPAAMPWQGPAAYAPMAYGYRSRFGRGFGRGLGRGRGRGFGRGWWGRGWGW